ncbi:hypothetical protein RHS01_02335 [Rhizoctonia solani]|uniref:Uncharacterized protein n=1 Tax=Rhizoctonia solani TaxID=456999 RepID=A0A8H7IHV1_9AGAM|nr:hypothetical protein RHS01_02335 [Rhizoctonia solani]
MLIKDYRVEVQRVGQVSGGVIYENQMPRIWLMNQEEVPSAGDSSWQDIAKVREYVLPMKLLARSHVTAETTLVTRRFITSPFMTDTILKFKPVYKGLSLYPIVQSSVNTLNSSDQSIAIATIRPTLNPRFIYHRQQTNVQDLRISPSDEACDYIEEYRSGSVLDVLGSVGGAMSITPFGLLGQFSSRDFKRRLRNEYHTQSDKDGTKTIQIVKFLRDFVMDFGPADLDSEPRSPNPQMKSLSAIEAQEEEPNESRIPLIDIESEGAPVREGECEAA